MTQPTKSRFVLYVLNHDDIEAIKDINPTHKEGDVVCAVVVNTFPNGRINLLCFLDGPDPLFVKIPEPAKTDKPETEKGCWHWLPRVDEESKKPESKK